jgi:hypothetical protein
MGAKGVLAAMLFGLVLSGAAVAADPFSPIDYDDDLLLPTSAFEWDGLYAGGLVGIWSGNSTYVYGGGLLGANFTFDSFLLGVEGRAVLYSDGDVGGDLAGRFGVLLDQVLLFGDLGVGVRDGSGHFFAGAGAEVALLENVSLAGQAEFVTGSGFNAVRGHLSLRFHF